MAEPFRSGFIAIAGKPNVGKSTLLNFLVGKPLSIVAAKPQTTRHRILGIVTSDRAQLIFVDTPGFHRPKHLLGQHMVRTATAALAEVDLILMLVDATSGLRLDDERLIEQIALANHPALAVINKIDLVPKPRLLPLIERCAKLHPFVEIIPICARTGEQVDRLRDAIIRRLPASERWFEPGQQTDRPLEFLAAEYIREQMIRATHEEVPHAVAVVVEELTPRGQGQATYLRATIYIERPSQKAILIGRRGSKLKTIGEASRHRIETEVGGKVYLDLWVKVAKDWREDVRMLQRFGYA